MDFNKKIIDIAIKNYMIISLKITKNNNKKRKIQIHKQKGYLNTRRNENWQRGTSNYYVDGSILHLIGWKAKE